MGMRYAAVFEDVAVSAAQDLFEITAPTDAAVIVHSVRVGQSSDFGDAAAEGLSISMVRGEATTSGSGGSTVTPAPLEAGFAAAGSTVEANNTTKQTVGSPAGTLTVLYNDAFNVQVGFLYQPVPEERPIISPGDLFTVELVGAPTDALTMSGTIVFEEIGG